MAKLDYVERLRRTVTREGLKNTALHACQAGLRRVAAWPVRLKRDLELKAKLPERIQRAAREISERPDRCFHELRSRTLTYIESNRKPGVQEGAYSYKPEGPPILYSSCYAALTRHLYNDLDGISPSSRLEWIRYLQTFQTDRGLFRDPVIENRIAGEADWWGWRHLTLHVLMALTALGGVAEKPFEAIARFKKKGSMAAWLDSLNWQGDPASVSNEIQNHAVMLQYARDFQMETWCDDSLREMYDWLDKAQDPASGLWGKNFDNPADLSLGVQTGYHLWLLYFYDHRPVRCIEGIIDRCLETQNIFGGFGVTLNSSACEDIDSVDPLVRLSFLTDYRRRDIREALERALPWILVHANPDGGWVFRRYEAFEYGHERMRAEAEESSMFPTWFRSLTLAYLGKGLPDSPVGSYPWKFPSAPGHQFWNESTLSHES